MNSLDAFAGAPIRMRNTLFARIGDAYDDLRAHQQGFMEGMRSALAVVLSRFNPESLEQRLINLPSSAHLGAAP